MRRVALCALILLLAPLASVAEEDLLAELDAGALEAVSDEELDSMRGGVLLHIDGLEIRMALGIQTSVDNQVLLRTELGVEDLQHADQFGTGAPSTAAVTAISEVPGALPTPVESTPFTGRETVLRTAGSLEGTQVHHVVGRHDLQAVVFNRLDGVSIQTLGEMQIEIGNFQQHQNTVNMNRAGSALSNRMQDTATFR
ncbi:MAG: hypothetical protein AAF430_20520 [Myxococcota bacterium]